MMINKRLIGTVSESKKYIAGNVIFQWIGMVANMGLILSIGYLMEKLLDKNIDKKTVIITCIVALAALIIRFGCARKAARMSFLASKSVKKKLREMIYKKLLRLGNSYQEKVATSEIVQVSVEGVEQLETYFGAYLPQFFYSMLAPITLFAVLSFISFISALVLLICVPMIPVAIAAVQTWAKKLLSKYWGQYTALGDTFLENLQGLTTLKIYKADDYKQKVMNEEAEKFRKITMKVLTMQLNSITIMDFIAFGGAALGVILAAGEFRAGNIGLQGCFAIILLSAEFFIPMRQLGSYFHVSMNGMAASDKIFRILDLEEPASGNISLDGKDCSISCQNVSFSYGKQEPEGEVRLVLKHVDMKFLEGNFTAIVGESGCGKSTLAAVLMGRNKGYEGEVNIGGNSLSDVTEESLMKQITYISHNAYLFKGTVRENLLMGNPKASEESMWSVLDKTNLSGFLKSENGLDTVLSERASNLSGGQCQRLALARALLHDSPVYIFDEASSNIDVESENAIMEQIYELAKRKTVILISHRLANVVDADRIYVMDKGCVVQSGKHMELLNKGGTYKKMWEAQQELENLRKEDGPCKEKIVG